MDVAPSSTGAHLCRLGNRLTCCRTMFSRCPQAIDGLPLATFLPHLPFDFGSLVGAIPSMLSAGQGIILHRLQLRTASVLALGDDVGGCEGKQQHYGCRRSDESWKPHGPSPIANGWYAEALEAAMSAVHPDGNGRRDGGFPTRRPAHETLPERSNVNHDGEVGPRSEAHPTECLRQEQWCESEVCQAAIHPFRMRRQVRNKRRNTP